MAKIKILLNNLEHFQTKYMNADIFLDSFNNLENLQKAHFNILLEELSVVLLKILPLLLKEFFDSIKEMIYIEIPDVITESEKKPINEDQCLKFNYEFINDVIEYFRSNIDIFKVLCKKNENFHFNRDEYSHLLLLLDLARYDSSYVTTSAVSSIKKLDEDEKLFDVFQKPFSKFIKIKEEKDELERYHERHKIKETSEQKKLNRVNSVLNITNNKLTKELRNRMEKIKRFNIVNKKTIFINPIFINMMKYINPKVKTKIMAEQIIERYKENEKKNKNSDSFIINIA